MNHPRSPAFLLGVVLLFTAGCTSESPAPMVTPSAVASASPSMQPSTSPSTIGTPLAEKMEFQKSVLKGKLGDGKSWELESRSIRYDDQRKVAAADGIRCTFFEDPQKKHRVVLTSQGADVDLATQNLTFRGPVMAHSNTGETLQIGHLRWDGKAKKFYGNENIRLERGTSWMVGDHLVADASLKTVQITGNVRIFLRDLNDLKVGQATSGHPAR